MHTVHAHGGGVMPSRRGAFLSSDEVWYPTIPYHTIEDLQYRRPFLAVVTIPAKCLYLNTRRRFLWQNEQCHSGACRDDVGQAMVATIACAVDGFRGFKT
eukprot:scaffold2657_cov89-Amphora_coffeaeformis.AAC.13